MSYLAETTRTNGQAPERYPRAMLLESINSPTDLARLDHEELEALCSEVRNFIVEAVAANSGHLGSNLGAVELTVALHRVFSSPRDILLWDTGHQAYVHKILTGRREMFSTLRQGGGLSGYPSRAESVHDWVENSHASTILSYAHGVAAAVARSSSPDRRVVAVIGDGSMTGGMAFEGLNNLGHSGSRVVVVLNDNGRSYAPTVSRLSESLTKIRLHPGLKSVRERIEERLRDLPRVGNLAYSGLQGFYSAVREVIEPPAFFEALGVRYVGPIDGHDIAGMEVALSQAASLRWPDRGAPGHPQGPGLRPRRGRRREVPARRPVFDPAIGPGEEQHALKGYTQAFNEAMIEAGERHPNMVAITAAMPGPTGLLPFAARWPDRFFDVGIAEQTAVTSAAGMAMGGLRPVVAVYSTFFSRAFDQANLDVGLHGLPVVFALDRAGHYRPGRAESSRHARHGPVPAHSRYDRLRPLVGPGAAGHAGNSARAQRPLRHPLPARGGPIGPPRPGRSGPQRPQGADRGTGIGLHPCHRQDARGGRGGGRHPGRRRRGRHGLGRPGGAPASILRCSPTPAATI